MEAVTGQRNQIEASNRSLKRSYGVDLRDYGKRLGRDKPFQTLAIAFALAADNIHRIFTGIKNLVAAKKPATTPKTRARRRNDMDGNIATHEAPIRLLSGAPPGS